MDSNQSDTLKAAVRKAEEATSDIRDKELRKVAFRTLLDYLLAGRVGAAPIPKPPRERPRDTTRRKKSGPMGWLEEIVDDGYFKQPRTTKEILEELAERAHHLELPDVTDQLQQLVRSRRLRRKKQKALKGTRKVWKYSNW